MNGYPRVRIRYRVMFPSSLIACYQRPSGVCIPQRDYYQGIANPDSGAHQRILFKGVDGDAFPAGLALYGSYGTLVDKDSETFAEKTQTINLRIEVLDLIVIQSRR